MRIWFLVLVLVLASNLSFANTPPQVPQVSGSLCSEDDPDFETFRYASQIPYCTRNVSGYTKAVIYDHYGIPKEERHNYTIDHIIPLSIGGSNHLDNLWPEHRNIKDCRYHLEVNVFKALRDSKITQDEAIAKIKQVKFQDICL